MDILLLIGPIVPSQYAPVVAKMYEEGMQPVILRVSTEYASESDFYNAASEVSPANLDIAAAELHADSWVQEKMQSVIDDAFVGKSLMDVKGVVLYADNDEYSSLTYMGWLLERLPATHAEYRVHVGENCEPWIDGDYGRLEITTGD